MGGYGGHGRIREDMEGLGRTWEDYGGHGRIRKDMDQ